MKAENFCFWLQGFFELQAPASITPEQAEQIRTHLALVFKHDPAMAHEPPKVRQTPPLLDLAKTGQRARHARDGMLFC